MLKKATGSSIAESLTICMLLRIFQTTRGQGNCKYATIDRTVEEVMRSLKHIKQKDDFLFNFNY